MKFVKFIILQLALISSFALMLSCEEEPYSPPINIPPTDEPEYEAVDLGLPSGVKWATFNVGARSPEGNGGYYAWGETETMFNYGWDVYKWVNEDRKITKYSKYLDHKDILDLEDDPAHIHWGGDWRTPTQEEQKELLENCSWELATLKSVTGYKVTGSNGNSIFLPLAGFRASSTVECRDDVGYYWSSSIYCYNGSIVRENQAFCLAMQSEAYDGGYSCIDLDRYFGCSVRPVCGGNVPVRYKVSVSSAGNGSVEITNYSSTELVFKPGTQISVIATPDDGYNFVGWFVGEDEEPVSTDDWYKFTVNEDVSLIAKFKAKEYINGYEYVDLGLPSGLKWAVCNINGAHPEDYGWAKYNLGSYYAWGETKAKGEFGWNNYKWCQGTSNTITKYCTASGNGTVDNKTVLDLEDDVAHVEWGATWRMPTYEELEELIENCTWTLTEIYGMKCYKVASKTNRNCIYLPFTGISGGDGEECGCFLSTSIHGGGYYVKCLFFNETTCTMSYTPRCYGYMVRPVSE